MFHNFQLRVRLLGNALVVTCLAFGISAFSADSQHVFFAMPAWGASSSSKMTPQKTQPTLSGPKPVATLSKEPCLVGEGANAVACSSYEETTSLDLVQRPAEYLNKLVKFEAEFNTFSTLGLDYSRAKRDSKDYYGLMVRRPDVTHHVIPLSELKIFAKRPDEEKETKKSDKTPPPSVPRKQEPADKSDTVLDSWMDLERGDRILIYGKVFSIALDDPWMDVQRIDLLKKAPSKKKKSSESTAKPVKP